IQKSGEYKLDFYEDAKFRSVTGKDYNHWLPIFINQQHFARGKMLIENSVSIIQNGTALGNKRFDFTPIMVLNVLTSLMNKSSVQLFNGQMFESEHTIQAYCDFLRLLMHFIQIYPELGIENEREEMGELLFFCLAQKLNNNIHKFIQDITCRNKKVIPDIGEFLIQIALSNKYQQNEIKKFVYEEYFARQIYWIDQKKIIDNLLHIQTRHLNDIFKAIQVSNHLLVFYLETAATFIFSGVKQ
ncbi:hypothetical protein DMUE_6228, partial [Dictyocoela muelleri]